ncbi:MAG: MarR family transcriptional regulator [Burkholderiaceae bacterium]|jgi:DNA-binding MarR family transcriptional regulator|nr:MarR family transcriptional regulator [Burkholderiaceae bacterium]
MNSSLPADIFEAMHELLHLFRARMREDMQALDADLTPNEVKVLMFVGRHPGRTQKDLVDHSHMDKAQLARMLAQLQDKGWLDREPDARDRRVRCLRLSAQGQTLADALRRSRQALAARLLQDWEPAAQRQLMDLLERARDSVESAP